MSLALCAAALLAAASGAHASVSTQFGFNEWTSSPNIALQQKMGMPVRRIFIFWDSVQPSPNQWNWQGYDRQYNALLSAGLKPEIDVFDSPCWARPSMACKNTQYTGPPDPPYDSNWTKFVKQVALRYPSAMAIEIWNEPNFIWNFYPHIDPARYTQLLSEAYKAVKDVRKQMPVIGGSIAGGAGDGGYSALGDQQFLQGMYAAGANSAMDGIGVHDYPIVQNSLSWTAAGFEPVLNRLRSVRAQYGAAQPIWVTEAGESTGTSPGWPPAASEGQQASDLVTIANDVQADGDVAALLIHTVQDAPYDPTDQYSGVDEGFGVFTSAGATKAAACALSAHFGGSLTC